MKRDELREALTDLLTKHRAIGDGYIPNGCTCGVNFSGRSDWRNHDRHLTDALLDGPLADLLRPTLAEPTEWGSKATAGGKVWLLADKRSDFPWVNEDGYAATWDGLCELGVES